MKQFSRIVNIITLLFILSPGIIFPYHVYTKQNCLSKMTACQSCRSLDSCAYPRSDYKVDNACVDFCLDYEHTLSECQKSCSN